MVHLGQVDAWVRWHTIRRELPQQHSECWNVQRQLHPNTLDFLWQSNKSFENEALSFVGALNFMFSPFCVQSQVQHTFATQQQEVCNQCTQPCLFFNVPTLQLTPDIWLSGKLVVSQAFRCGPLDRKLGTSMSCVCVVLHESGQTEVCHFH